MNSAICIKRLDQFQPDREYKYVADQYNGKEIVDLYDNFIRIASFNVDVFNQYFMKIGIMDGGK